MILHSMYEEKKLMVVIDFSIDKSIGKEEARSLFEKTLSTEYLENLICEGFIDAGIEVVVSVCDYKIVEFFYDSEWAIGGSKKNEWHGHVEVEILAYYYGL
tara:strand:+ start:345 stop:647 length:303 start_codon:yes stop_codon:yes gene_type:complete